MKIKAIFVILATAATIFAQAENQPAAQPAAQAAAQPTAQVVTEQPAAQAQNVDLSTQGTKAEITEATQQGQDPNAEQPEAPSVFSTFLPFILLFVVMWLFFIRPKQKEMKKMDQMRKDLKKGDKVMTAAGIVGIVTNMDADSSLITIRTGSTTLIDFEKAAILRVLNPETKADDAKAEEKK